MYIYIDYQDNVLEGSCVGSVYKYQVSSTFFRLCDKKWVSLPLSNKLALVLMISFSVIEKNSEKNGSAFNQIVENNSMSREQCCINLSDTIAPTANPTRYYNNM